MRKLPGKQHASKETADPLPLHNLYLFYPSVKNTFEELPSPHSELEFFHQAKSIAEDFREELKHREVEAAKHSALQLAKTWCQWSHFWGHLPKSAGESSLKWPFPQRRFKGKTGYPDKKRSPEPKIIFVEVCHVGNFMFFFVCEVFLGRPMFSLLDSYVYISPTQFAKHSPSFTIRQLQQTPGATCHLKRLHERIPFLVGGLRNHGILWLSIYWEFHHPNWRTHMFQRGRYTTNQFYIAAFEGTCGYAPYVCSKHILDLYNHRQFTHRKCVLSLYIYILCICTVEYTEFHCLWHYIHIWNIFNI